MSFGICWLHMESGPRRDGRLGLTSVWIGWGRQGGTCRGQNPSREHLCCQQPFVLGSSRLNLRCALLILQVPNYWSMIVFVLFILKFLGGPFFLAPALKYIHLILSSCRRAKMGFPMRFEVVWSIYIRNSLHVPGFLHDRIFLSYERSVTTLLHSNIHAMSNSHSTFSIHNSQSRVCISFS